VLFEIYEFRTSLDPNVIMLKDLGVPRSLPDADHRDRGNGWLRLERRAVIATERSSHAPGRRPGSPA
jgi:hypothetical protein